MAPRATSDEFIIKWNYPMSIEYLSKATFNLSIYLQSMCQNLLTGEVFEQRCTSNFTFMCYLT